MAAPSADDRVVAVTGASRDIGSAIAEAPADAGSRVARLSRKGVSAPRLVNYAGQHDQGRSAELASADFAHLLNVNATALFAACREAYPYRKESRGQIVNLGSYYDKLGVRYHAAYCASKAAVAAIGRCLAIEWAHDGIRITMVAPGFIGTDLNRRHMERESFRGFITRRTPSGEIGTPGEVGRLVALLYLGDIRFLSGETIHLDGGQGMAH